jgi:hypothetical protein
VIGLPRFITKSMMFLEDISTLMDFRLAGLKPMASAKTSYLPGERQAVYTPSPLLSTLVLRLEALSSKRIFTLGIIHPSGVVTLPSIPPQLFSAIADAQGRGQSSSAAKQHKRKVEHRKFRFIISKPPNACLQLRRAISIQAEGEKTT